MRKFDTGATRDTDKDKLDYEGFLSPFVLKRYAEYLHKHRLQTDGKMRDSDNWQNGIPKNVYMKSLCRHHMEAWLQHRVIAPHSESLQESLCGVIFNAMGYLYELLEEQR